MQTRRLHLSWGSPAVMISLLMVTLVLFSAPASALTPAGTTIPNVGSLDYTVGPNGYVLSSNPTNVTVAAMTALVLQPNQAGFVQPGYSIQYAHQVMNNGNVPDTFDLQAASSLGFAVELLASDGTPLSDSNADGRPDTGILLPGNSFSVIVRLTAPAGLDPDQQDLTVITAFSAAVPAVMAEVTDTTTILQARFWDPLEKTVEPEGQVTPGSTIIYTNTFGNAGNIPATNVVIEDILDIHLIYMDGSATLPAGIPGTTVTYDAALRTVRWTIPSIPAGYSGKVSFKARIDTSTPSDTVIENRISVRSDQTPEQQYSNRVTTAVVEQPLRIFKSVDKAQAEIGDAVNYSIRVENTSEVIEAADMMITDRLPKGFRYIRKSTVLDGRIQKDPEGGTNPIWMLGTLAPGASMTLSYKAIISVDAPLGNGVNTATVKGKSPGGNRLSAGPASAVVKVQEGVLNSKAVILGRVFVDRNGDKMPDEDEPGLEGVRLYLEDGSYVITDKEGKFSFNGIGPGEHVLKLDSITIPPGYESVPINSAFAGDGGSQFITVPFGGPARGDFALVHAAGGQVDAQLKEAAKAKDGMQFTFSVGGSAPQTLEQKISAMPVTPGLVEPGNGAILGKDWCDLIVRMPSGIGYTLTVNGLPLPEKQIGKTIEEKTKNIRLLQYVGIRLRPGPNTIVLRSAMPAGADIQEITVVVPGPPAKITMTPDKAEIPADGRTQVPFTVQLLDRWDKPALGEHVITVITEKGTILEEDLDPSAPGHQVRYSNGSAGFRLRSTLKTGNDKVRALLGNVLQTAADVYFTGELRDWIVVGLGTFRVGNNSAGGNIEGITETDDFDDGIYHDGRLAFFIKGKILGKYLLTAAYDSDKEEQEGLFQKVDPEKYYPVYGDAGESGYEAESSKKLYVKIERGRSYLLAGDFHTNLSENEFTRYERSFNGVKADIDTEHVTVKAFGTYTNHMLMKDEIPGNGTSGYYFLKKNPVIENSEQVWIEVRNRYHSEQVLSRTDKVRYADYSIDYGRGTILFKEPVPSVDRELNPVTIVVTYESEDPGDKYYIYGGRAAARLGDRAEIGVTAIREEKELKDSTLYGMDARLKVAGNTHLKAEAAWSDTYEEGRGSAWKVEIMTELVNRFRLGAYYRKVGEGFRNPSMSGGEGGTEKYGAKASYRFSDTTEILAESFVEKGEAQERTLLSHSFGVRRRISFLNVEAGFRSLSEESKDQPDKTSQMIFAGVGGNITPRLGISVLREQALQTPAIDGYPTRTMVKLDYQLTDRIKTYLTQEFQEGAASRKNITLLGIESRLTERMILATGYQLESGEEGRSSLATIELNTKWREAKGFTLSTRTGYQIQNALSESSGQAILGLNTRWEVMKGLTMSATAERVQAVQGSTDSGTSTAVTLGAEYLGSEDLKASGRYELRLARQETTHLLALGGAVRYGSSLTFLGKMSYWRSEKDQGDDSIFDGALGIAYRPLGKPSIYLLSVLRYKTDKRGGTETRTETQSLITSTELSYRLSPRMTLHGKYAGKLSWEGGNRLSLASYTDLILAGIHYDLSDRWDVAVYGRLMNQYRTKTHSLGGVVKLGYRLFKNIHVGAGYNLARLDDRDLSGESYRSNGPFVEVKFKFDEDLFASWLPRGEGTAKKE